MIILLSLSIFNNPWLFKFPYIPNSVFVNISPITFMGREADQAGLNYWLGRMKAGDDRKTVLEAFAACDEFKTIVKSFGL